jgi:hypothetical protein
VRAEGVWTRAAGVVAWAWVDAGEVAPSQWWRPVGARMVVLVVWFVAAMLVFGLIGVVGEVVW